jgi:hypothetical protein
MFSCRIENKHDFYNTLYKWWTDWKFPIMNIDMLPNNIFVVSNDGVDLYAIPVYLSDSDICWMGFITGNRYSTKEMRSGSLGFLLNYTEQYLKNSGRKFIMTVSGTPILKKTFTDNGYLLSGENINEYVKKI